LTVFGGFSSLVREFVFLRNQCRCQPLPWPRAHSGKDPMPDQTDPALIAEAPSPGTTARTSMSRREFARRAALASAVASIAPIAQGAAVTAYVSHAAPSTGESIAQAPPPASPPAAAASQNPPANAPRLSAESQSEADARFQSILVLYGSRFSNEQKNELHRLCVAVQPALDHIRAYKIENGDGPALYLKPQYEREKKPKPAAAAPVKTAPLAKAEATGNAPKKP
jgi:hypothetical protein